MSLIRKLAAGVVLATSLAGAANAVEFERVVVGGTVTDNVGNGFTFGSTAQNTAGLTGPQVTTAISPTTATKLALEVVNTTPAANTGADDGLIHVVFDASTGNFPSGNIIAQITLSGGATFGRQMVGGDFLFSCEGGVVTTPAPNANLSTGGAVGDTTANFVISNLNTCDNGDFGAVFSLPVDITTGAAATPTVQFGLVTESGSTPVDAGPSSVRLLNVVKAFDVTVAATPAINNFAALTPTPLFTTLAPTITAGGTDGNSATLGTVQLVIDTAAYQNLTGGAAVAANLADTTDVSVLRFTFAAGSGNFAGLDLIGYPGATGLIDLGTAFSAASVQNANSGAGSAGTPSANTTATSLVVADFTTARSIVFVDAFGADPRNTAPLQNSTYSLTPTLTLGAAFTSPTLPTTPLASIIRQGTTITFPWFSSGTQAASTNSTSTLRIGNLTGTAVPGVFVSVFDSSTGNNPNSVAVAGGLPANGELVLTSQSLQTLLGVNFGRADVQVTLETSPSNLTARRFVFNGASFTELSPGVVNQPQ